MNGFFEASLGDLAEDEAVHIETGVDPAIGQHRGGRRGAPERVAEHPDAVEVEDSEEGVFSAVAVETRQRIEHVSGVGDANGQRVRNRVLPLAHLADRDRVAVGEGDDVRVVWVIDCDDDVAVAREVFDEAGVELALDVRSRSRTGRRASRRRGEPARRSRSLPA